MFLLKYLRKVAILFVTSKYTRCLTDFKFFTSAHIMSQDLLHPRSMEKIRKGVDGFLGAIRDNNRLLSPNVTTNSRLEFVVVLSYDIPNKICASDYINEEALATLLEEYPMLLPFAEDKASNLNFMERMNEISRYLLTELESVRFSKGSYIDSWRSFQAELSLQWFFWGSLFKKQDTRLANLLGIGWDSSSTRRGILGLNAPTSASIEGSPPPLSICTSSVLERDRIERLFNLTRVGSKEQIGEELVQVLLKDFFSNKTVDYNDLKSDGVYGRIVEALQYEELAAKISQNRSRFKWPYTFGHATREIEETELEKVILAGLLVMRLKKFPAFKLTENNNPKISWGKKAYSRLHDGSAQSILTIQPSLIEEVLAEIEKRKLTNPSNIAIFNSKPMPWISHCMSKFNKEIARRPVVLCLTFITCVILYQSGIFVHYTRLRDLRDNLPQNMKPEKMVERKILSPHHFAGFFAFHLNRVHESIPSSMPLFSTNKDPQKKVTPQEQIPEEAITGETNPTEMDEFPSIQQTVIVDNAGKKWTAVELALVEICREDDASIAKMFEKFKKECSIRQMPIRSYNAFRCRLNR